MFKAGNSIILRGGSEAINTNMALAKVIIKAATDSRASRRMYSTY